MILTASKRDGMFNAQYLKIINFFYDDTKPDSVLAQAYYDIARAVATMGYKFKIKLIDFQQVGLAMLRNSNIQDDLHVPSYEDLEKKYNALRRNPTSPEFKKFSMDFYRELEHCIEHGKNKLNKASIEK